MGCHQDKLGHYRLSATTTEEEILRVAEEILTGASSAANSFQILPWKGPPG